MMGGSRNGNESASGATTKRKEFQSTWKPLLRNVALLGVIVYALVGFFFGSVKVLCGRGTLDAVGGTGSRSGTSCPVAPDTLHPSKRTKKRRKRRRWQFWRKKDSSTVDDTSLVVQDEAAAGRFALPQPAEEEGNVSPMCHAAARTVSTALAYLPLTDVFLRPVDTGASSTTASCPAIDESDIRRVVERHQHDHPRDVVDRVHPVRRMVDEAATFFRRRRAKEAAIPPEKKRRKRRREAATWSADAMQSDYQLTPGQSGLVRRLAARVRQLIEETDDDGGRSFDERMAAIWWGGPGPGGSPWWTVEDKRKGKENAVYSDGGRLVAAFLRIMEWPQNLLSKFPFKLCAKGCEAETAVVHTVEWREKYKPFCMTPLAIAENEKGWIYHRGYSHSGVDGNSEGGHSIVFYRPGLHKADPSNPEPYARVLLNMLESAVADNLSRTGGTLGKYNIVEDCSGFGLGMMPKLHDVKRAMLMMQDHFPDRLGILLIANLSGPAQMFLKMIKPFISEAVRSKLHVLPNDQVQRMEMLQALMDDEFIPDWLGGVDDYRFDAHQFYNQNGKCKFTEREGIEYKITMPYHA